MKNGVNRLPHIANVPYLDVVAATTTHGGRLTLFCVNRSLDRDIPTNIDIRGFSAANAAQVQTLQAGYISEGNDEDEADRVIPTDTTEPVHGSTLHHVFQHESVTVITFKKSS